MKRAYLVVAAAAFAILLTACSEKIERDPDVVVSSLSKIKIEDSYKIPSNTKSFLAQDIPFSTKNVPAERKFIKTAELKFKVKNVLNATHEVEKLASKFGGYTISSEINNSEENSKEIPFSCDSLLRLSQVLISNEMVIKVPSQQLDSLINALRPLFVFLDYRKIKLEDITRQIEGHTNIIQSYKEAIPRMEKQVESRERKVNHIIAAEQQLVDNKVRVAEAEAIYKQIEDDLKFSTLSIEIYQSPILVREVTLNFNEYAQDEQRFGPRIIESINDGWYCIKELILVFVKLWGFFLLLISSIYLFKFLRKKYQKKKNTTPDKKG